MKNIFILYKKEGQTPLQALDAFRLKNKEYKEAKMTYAGRLDPMANGLLLVLAGSEIKGKEKYLSLEKEYEFEILFGFATDTYDILGKVKSSREHANSKHELETIIRQNLKPFTGKFIQKYPLFSSKTVKGKQLFEYGRRELDVLIPGRQVFVKNLTFFKLRKTNNRKLLSNIEKRIKRVKGDFRQEEILRIWRKKLDIKKPRTFFIGSFKTKCASGTYVRGIANSLGVNIGVPALAFSIKRMKIGKWSKAS